MMSTAYTKGTYNDSKMSTVYAADERVHTFGSTYRVTDENILSEKSKMTSPKQIELSLNAPSVTPFVQVTNNEKNTLVATSLNNENLITKETYGNSSSHYDPSDMESVNLKELRQKAKKRSQAVLISDSYQDKEFTNLLLSGEGLEGNKARPIQGHYQLYKSPPQLRSENSQPTNIITIEDYRANDGWGSDIGYDRAFPKGDFEGKGLSTMGSSSSKQFELGFNYTNEVSDSQKVIFLNEESCVYF